MTVDFMIIGAQKCGTTTLFEILNKHPSLIGCSKKEPHFFSKLNTNWKNDLVKYHELFKQKEAVKYFEASTSYTFYPMRKLNIWDDIFEYNPNMKFIYIVRNPIDRIISHYMHNYEEGWTDVNIEEALINHRNYIDITRYYTQISPYIRKFGKKNILIIDFEDLIHQRKSVLKKISEFLCINFNGFTDYEKIHENKSVGGHKKHHKYNYPSISLKIIKSLFPTMYKKITDNSKRGFTEKPKLNIKYRRMIKNLLYLDIIELQKLIDKDLGKWLCIED